MKKVNPAILSLSGVAFLLFSIMVCAAKTETVMGKLVYYQYDAYPYVLELDNGNAIALEVNLDKKFRNQSMDRLLGKMVQVSGPARVITAMTELHGLKIIDIRPGKGQIAPLR